LRANPHRLNLGKIGLQLSESNGRTITLKDLSNIHQTADIWEGILKSSFQIDGVAVNVKTACHPDIDQISAQIQSKLLQSGQIRIRFDFPYGSGAWGADPADWNSPDRHASEIIAQDAHSIIIQRTLDADQYFVLLHWSGKAKFEKQAAHSFQLSGFDQDQFQFSIQFSKTMLSGTTLAATDSFSASKAYWYKFWESGGAIDLSHCKDSRAFELERRIVLSRYLTAGPMHGIASSCGNRIDDEQAGTENSTWKCIGGITCILRSGVIRKFWKEPCRGTNPSFQRQNNGGETRLRRSPMAENDIARWKRKSFLRRRISHLATTASYLLRRAALSIEAG